MFGPWTTIRLLSVPALTSSPRLLDTNWLRRPIPDTESVLQTLEDLNRFINDPTLPQIDGWPHDFYQDQVDVISHFLDRDTVYAIPFDTPT